MRQLGLGQIGVGTWGQVMLGAFGANAKANVLAVCDINGEKAKQAAEQWGIPAYYDNVAELLKHPGIEAVGVATPDFAHREPVVRALEAGKHVLTQKPLATTVADCKAMLAAEQQSGRYLMIDYQQRWGTTMAEARKAVESESFGMVVHGHIRLSDTTEIPTQMLSWAGQSNVLWFLGTHTVDLVRFVTGSEVKRVYAVSRRGVLESLGVTTPDFFQATLEMEDGSCFQMENSWVLPEGDSNEVEMTMNLYGANECIRVNVMHSNLITRVGNTKTTLPPASRSLLAGRGHSIGHFIDSVLAGRTPSVTGQDGLMNTAILVAIEKSVAEKRPVDLSEVL